MCAQLAGRAWRRHVRAAPGRTVSGECLDPAVAGLVFSRRGIHSPVVPSCLFFAARDRAELPVGLPDWICLTRVGARMSESPWDDRPGAGDRHLRSDSARPGRHPSRHGGPGGKAPIVVVAYETITTWAPVAGEGGGCVGSKPAESIVSDEPSHADALMRHAWNRCWPGCWTCRSCGMAGGPRPGAPGNAWTAGTTRMTRIAER